MEQVISTKTIIYGVDRFYILHGIGIEVSEWMETINLDYYFAKLKKDGDSILVKAVLPTNGLRLVLIYRQPPIDIRYLVANK